MSAAKRCAVATAPSGAGPASLASEQGGTVITVKGTGLNTQTFDWADFGDPGQASSQDTDWVFQTGTELQIESLAFGGEGVARLGDSGYVVFVADAIPGDRVRAEVQKAKRA